MTHPVIPLNASYNAVRAIADRFDGKIAVGLDEALSRFVDDDTLFKPGRVLARDELTKMFHLAKTSVLVEKRIRKALRNYSLYLRD